MYWSAPGDVQGERAAPARGAAAPPRLIRRRSDGPSRCSIRTWGRSPSSDRVEAADQDRMGEAPQGLDLLGELAQRLLVGGLVGAQQLRDRERVEPLVPDQVDLVAVAAADALQRVAVGGDRLALLEVPARVLAHHYLRLWQHALKSRSGPRSPLASIAAMATGGTSGTDRAGGAALPGGGAGAGEAEARLRARAAGPRRRADVPGRAARAEDQQGGRRTTPASPVEITALALQRARRPTATSGTTARPTSTATSRSTGDPNVLKLIAQVVERHEQRARLKKVH